jgi:hypothetical protein
MIPGSLPGYFLSLLLRLAASPTSIVGLACLTGQSAPPYSPVRKSFGRPARRGFAASRDEGVWNFRASCIGDAGTNNRFMFCMKETIR